MKRRKVAQAIRFRVFVDLKSSPQFFEVVIWPTKKAMERHRWNGKKPPSNTEAYWSPNNDELEADCHCGEKHRKAMPLIGTIHFYRTQLSYGIVAHEVFHAVMTWAVINGADPVMALVCKPDANEICARLMGNTVVAIIDQIKKEKIKIESR